MEVGKEGMSGGHLCHVCGYQYPNAHPSAKLRRSHRKHCGGKAAPEDAAAAAAEEERNAGEEGVMLGGGGGGGEPEGNGSAGEANAGSVLRGSAGGDADSVEEKEITEHASPNVSPNVSGVPSITGYCSEVGVTNCTSRSDEITKEVGRPAEREDSLDEYQDASPFLHQSDSEVATAVAQMPDFSVEEIKKLDSVSLGGNVPAGEISVEMDGLWKDQLPGQPNMANLSGESKVGKEDVCYLDNRAPGLAEHTVMLESSDGSPEKVCSDNINGVDSKPDKTSDFSEFIGDLSGSARLISDLESQSMCPRKVESLMENSKDALHIISEVSPSSQEKVGSANGESEAVKNYRIDFVQTEDEVKLTSAVSTLADCPSEYKHVKDTSDVQLPVENSDSISSLDGHPGDHVVTDMDSMWGCDDEDICREGIKGNFGELGFSCEVRPQHIEQLADKADENPSIEKPNVVAAEEVCSKEIDPEVPIDQVSASQEHAALLMDQVSTKNPFILDDTRSEDLFELATESYHSEAPNVAESKLQVDFTPLPLDQLTISDQISIAEGQHTVISDDRILAISSTCGNEPAVDTEDMSVSTTGVNFVPSEVTPLDFSTVPTSQDTNAPTDDNEKTPPEYMSTKDMTAAVSVDNVEKKETEGSSVQEMNSILKAGNNEEEKLTNGTCAEMNALKHKDDAEDTGAKGVLTIGTMESADVENQTEDTDAKEMKPELKTDNADVKMQTNNTSTEMSEKNLVQDTCSKDLYTIQSTANFEQNKHTEEPVGQEGTKQKEDISPTVVKQNSERVHVPLKVLLAEASVETKEKKTTAKERVLSFRRRVSKDDSSSAKSGSPKSGADDKYWSSPARLPENNAEKKSPKARKQPWIPFICCHSVH
uniref:Uncharacterized protein n=1 Tax=Leersia perrieri TaxID=77586 RepID=A0A0D9XFB8_9ORYZ